MSINQVRLESLLLSLKETRIPNEQHDYDVLFPPKKGPHRKSANQRQQFMSKLLKGSSAASNVEKEVVNLYFERNQNERNKNKRKRQIVDVDEDEEEDQNKECHHQVEENFEEHVLEDFDTTADFVVATQVDNQWKAKQREENEQVLKWSSYLGNSSLDLTKLNQFISLPDNVFETVCSTANTSFMPVETLTKIVTTACQPPSRVSEKKLEALANYLLLSKFCEPDMKLRTVYPLYQKLLSATNAIVMTKCVLLPMFMKNVQIPKPLLNGIDKKYFFNLAITWLDENYMELTTEFTATLNPLLEGIRDMDDQNQEAIVKLLERSLRYKPEEADFSAFFHLVVNKLGEVMTENNLKELQKLNYSNKSNMKNLIQEAIKKHLSTFS